MGERLVCPENSEHNTFTEYARAWRTVTENLEPLREWQMLQGSLSEKQYLCESCRRKAKSIANNSTT